MWNANQLFDSKYSRTHHGLRSLSSVSLPIPSHISMGMGMGMGIGMGMANSSATRRANLPKRLWPEVPLDGSGPLAASC
jgi:hypothetical protein